MNKSPSKNRLTSTGLIVLGLALIGCASAPHADLAISERDEASEGGQAPVDEQREPVAETVEPNLATMAGPRDLLGGRFRIEFPAGLAPTQTNTPWDFTDQPTHYDAFALTYRDCPLIFAARSDGLVRPEELTVGEGEERLWVPSAGASPRLEVLTTHTRSFETLGEVYAAIGAVVFEADGSATDLYVWPDVPEFDGFEDSELDWVDWQRADPRLAACFEAAEALLGEVIPTLVANEPFAPLPATLEFALDPETELPVVYEASLPPGWIITRAAAFDARFDRLHRRQAWSWAVGPPSARAELWTFSGGGDDEPRRLGRRRARLFDHDLRFDRNDQALIVFPPYGIQQFVQLFGSGTERNELVRILSTFRRASVTPSQAGHEGCAFVVNDADGQTNVRAASSARSDVVGTFGSGTAVVPTERRGRWLRIDAPIEGWIWSANLERRCVPLNPGQ